MKKYFYLFLTFITFFSCTTRPTYINTSLEKDLIFNSRQIVNEGSSEKLEIYFPLFTNNNGEKIGGDGIVIIFPNKEVMIIDGFYSSAANSFINFLKDDLKIEKIDYLVATHFHADHIGSFSKILDSFQVSNFYSNGAPLNSNLSSSLLEKCKQLGITETVLKEGDNFKIADVSIDVLWPSLSENDLYKIYYEPGKTAETINLSSLVFKMTFKDFSILFTGDLYKKGERTLVKKYGDLLKSTILKAPHHGDPYTSNSRKFLLTVNPELTIAQTPEDFLFFTKARFVSLNKHLIKVEKPGFIKIETTGFGYSVSEFIEE